MNLPTAVDLNSHRQKQEDHEDRVYGAVEYAKDGLLPLLERLGQGGPWLGRMKELMRAVDDRAAVVTRYGLIASEESEVNGQTLQVVSRLYWATGDDGYRTIGQRLARAYLDLALPDTKWMPARTWDFRRERANTDRAQIRDHGNEVIAGLVEFHLIETMRGAQETAEHRAQIRTMLDALLLRGRTSEGLWKSAIDVDTGESLKDTLSDNWGYLYAAYLTQAMIEESWSGGDLERARRYRAEAEGGLRAASRLDLYPWQGSEQDGYADTLESALYLLSRIPSAEAAAWLDREAGTLFGAQDSSGRVEDRYLDGNFVRTALLYAEWQARGIRLIPWEPGVMLGAAPNGDCLALAISSSRDWQGRLTVDEPRHRLNVGLPINYPRLNEWPEWFAASPEQHFSLDRVATGGDAVIHDGASLAAGVNLSLTAGQEQRLRLCASTP